MKRTFALKYASVHLQPGLRSLNQSLKEQAVDLKHLHSDSLINLLEGWTEWDESADPVNLQLLEDGLFAVQWALICAMHQVGQSEFVLQIPTFESPISTVHTFTHPKDALAVILRWSVGMLTCSVNKDGYLAVPALVVCTSALDDCIAGLALNALFALSIYYPSGHRDVYTYDSRTLITNFPLLIAPLMDIINAFSIDGHIPLDQIASGSTEEPVETFKYLIDLPSEFREETCFLGNNCGTYYYADWLSQYRDSGEAVGDESLVIEQQRAIDVENESLRFIVENSASFGIPVRYRYRLLWRARIQKQRYQIACELTNIRSRVASDGIQSNESSGKLFDMHRWLFWTMCVLITTQAEQSSDDSQGLINCAHPHIVKLFSNRFDLQKDILQVLLQTYKQIQNKQSISKLLNSLYSSSVDFQQSSHTTVVESDDSTIRNIKKRLFATDEGNEFVRESDNSTIEISEDLLHICSNLICGLLLRVGSRSRRQAFGSFKYLQYCLGFYAFKNPNISGVSIENEHIFIKLFQNEITDLTNFLNVLAESASNVCEIGDRLSQISSTEAENSNELLLNKLVLKKIERVEKYFRILRSTEKLEKILDIWKRNELMQHTVKFAEACLKCRTITALSSANRTNNSNSNDIVIIANALSNLQIKFNMAKYFDEYYCLWNVEAAASIYLDEFISRSDSTAEKFIYDCGGGAILTKRMHLEMFLISQSKQNEVSIQPLPRSSMKCVYQSFVLIVLSTLISLTEIIPGLPYRSDAPATPSATQPITDEVGRRLWWFSGSRQAELPTPQQQQQQQSPSPAQSAATGYEEVALSSPAKSGNASSSSVAAIAAALGASNAYSTSSSNCSSAGIRSGGSISNSANSSSINNSNSANAIDIITEYSTHWSFRDIMTNLLRYVACYSSPILSCALACIRHIISEDPSPPQVLLALIDNGIVPCALKTSGQCFNLLDVDSDLATTLLDFIDQISFHKRGLDLVFPNNNYSTCFALFFEKVLLNPKYLDMESMQLFSDLPLNTGSGFLSIFRHVTGAQAKGFSEFAKHFSIIRTKMERKYEHYRQLCSEDSPESSLISNDFQLFSGLYDNTMLSDEYSSYCCAYSSLGCLSKAIDSFAIFQKYIEQTNGIGELYNLLRSSLRSPLYLMTSLATSIRSQLVGFPPLTQGVNMLLSGKYMKRCKKFLSKELIEYYQSTLLHLNNAVEAFLALVGAEVADGVEDMLAIKLKNVISNAPNSSSSSCSSCTLPSKQLHKSYVAYSEVFTNFALWSQMLDNIGYIIGEGDNCSRELLFESPVFGLTLGLVMCPQMCALLQAVCDLTVISSNRDDQRTDSSNNSSNASNVDEFYVYKIMILSTNVSVFEDIGGVLHNCMAFPVGGTIEACLQCNCYSPGNEDVLVYYRLLHHKNLWIELFNESFEEQFDVIGIRTASQEEVERYSIRETYEQLMSSDTYYTQLAIDPADSNTLQSGFALEVVREVSMRKCGLAAFESTIHSTGKLIGSVLSNLEDMKTFKKMKPILSFLPELLESFTRFAPTVEEVAQLDNKQLISDSLFVRAYNVANIFGLIITKNANFSWIIAYVAMLENGKHLDAVLRSCMVLIRGATLAASVNDKYKDLSRYCINRSIEALQMLHLILSKFVNYSYRQRADRLLSELYSNYSKDKVIQLTSRKIADHLIDLLRCGIHLLPRLLRNKLLSVCNEVMYCWNQIPSKKTGRYEPMPSSTNPRTPTQSEVEQSITAFANRVAASLSLTGESQAATTAVPANEQIPLADSERVLNTENISLIGILDSASRADALRQCDEEFLSGLPWAMIAEAAHHSNAFAQGLFQRYPSLQWGTTSDESAMNTGVIFWKGVVIDLSTSASRDQVIAPAAAAEASTTYVPPASDTIAISSQLQPQKNIGQAGAEDSEGEGEGDDDEGDDDGDWESIDDDEDEDVAEDKAAEVVEEEEDEEEDDDANWEDASDVSGSEDEDEDESDTKEEATSKAIDSGAVVEAKSISKPDFSDLTSSAKATADASSAAPAGKKKEVDSPLQGLTNDMLKAIDAATPSRYRSELCSLCSLLAVKVVEDYATMQWNGSYLSVTSAPTLFVSHDVSRDDTSSGRPMQQRLIEVELLELVNGAAYMFTRNKFAKFHLINDLISDFGEPTVLSASEIITTSGSSNSNINSSDKVNNSADGNVAKGADIVTGQDLNLNSNGGNDAISSTSTEMELSFSALDNEKNYLSAAAYALSGLIPVAINDLHRLVEAIKSPKSVLDVPVRELDQTLYSSLLAITYCLCNKFAPLGIDQYHWEAGLNFISCGNFVTSQFVDVLALCVRIYPPYRCFLALLQQGMSLRLSVIAEVPMTDSIWIVPGTIILDYCSHACIFHSPFGASQSTVGSQLHVVLSLFVSQSIQFHHDEQELWYKNKQSQSHKDDYRGKVVKDMSSITRQLFVNNLSIVQTSLEEEADSQETSSSYSGIGNEYDSEVRITSQNADGYTHIALHTPYICQSLDMIESLLALLAEKHFQNRFKKPNKGDRLTIQGTQVFLFSADLVWEAESVLLQTISQFFLTIIRDCLIEHCSASRKLQIQSIANRLIQFDAVQFAGQSAIQAQIATVFVDKSGLQLTDRLFHLLERSITDKRNTTDKRGHDNTFAATIWAFEREMEECSLGMTYNPTLIANCSQLVRRNPIAFFNILSQTEQAQQLLPIEKICSNSLDQSQYDHLSAVDSIFIGKTEVFISAIQSILNRSAEHFEQQQNGNSNLSSYARMASDYFTFISVWINSLTIVSCKEVYDLLLDCSRLRVECEEMENISNRNDLLYKFQLVKREDSAVAATIPAATSSATNQQVKRNYSLSVWQFALRFALFNSLRVRSDRDSAATVFEVGFMKASAGNCFIALAACLVFSMHSKPFAHHMQKLILDQFFDEVEFTSSTQLVVLSKGEHLQNKESLTCEEVDALSTLQYCATTIVNTIQPYSVSSVYGGSCSDKLMPSQTFVSYLMFKGMLSIFNRVFDVCTRYSTNKFLESKSMRKCLQAFAPVNLVLMHLNSVGIAYCWHMTQSAKLRRELLQLQRQREEQQQQEQEAVCAEKELVVSASFDGKEEIVLDMTDFTFGYDWDQIKTASLLTTGELTVELRDAKASLTLIETAAVFTYPSVVAKHMPKPELPLTSVLNIVASASEGATNADGQATTIPIAATESDHLPIVASKRSDTSTANQPTAGNASNERVTTRNSSHSSSASDDSIDGVFIKHDWTNDGSNDDGTNDEDDSNVNESFAEHHAHLPLDDDEDRSIYTDEEEDEEEEEEEGEGDEEEHEEGDDDEEDDDDEDDQEEEEEEDDEGNDNDIESRSDDEEEPHRDSSWDSDQNSLEFANSFFQYQNGRSEYLQLGVAEQPDLLGKYADNYNYRMKDYFMLAMFFAVPSLNGVHFSRNVLNFNPLLNVNNMPHNDQPSNLRCFGMDYRSPHSFSCCDCDVQFAKYYANILPFFVDKLKQSVSAFPAVEDCAAISKADDDSSSSSSTGSANRSTFCSVVTTSPPHAANWTHVTESAPTTAPATRPAFGSNDNRNSTIRLIDRRADLLRLYITLQATTRSNYAKAMLKYDWIWRLFKNCIFYFNFYDCFVNKYGNAMSFVSNVSFAVSWLRANSNSASIKTTVAALGKTLSPSDSLGISDDNNCKSSTSDSNNNSNNSNSNSQQQRQLQQQVVFNAESFTSARVAMFAFVNDFIFSSTQHTALNEIGAINLLECVQALQTNKAIVDLFDSELSAFGGLLSDVIELLACYSEKETPYLIQAMLRFVWTTLFTLLNVNKGRKALPHLSDLAIKLLIDLMLCNFHTYPMNFAKAHQILTCYSRQFDSWNRIMNQFRILIIEQINAIEQETLGTTTAEILAYVTESHSVQKLSKAMQIASSLTESVKAVYSANCYSTYGVSPAATDSWANKWLTKQIEEKEQSIVDTFARTLAPVTATSLAWKVLSALETSSSLSVTEDRSSNASDSNTNSSSSSIRDKNLSLSLLPFFESFIVAVCTCVYRSYVANSRTEAASATSPTVLSASVLLPELASPSSSSSSTSEAVEQSLAAIDVNSAVGPPIAEAADQLAGDDVDVGVALLASPPIPLKREFSLPDSRFQSQTMKKMSLLARKLSEFDLSSFDLVGEGDMRLRSPIADGSISINDIFLSTSSTSEAAAAASVDDLALTKPVNMLIKFVASGKYLLNTLLRKNIHYLDGSLMLLHILPECRQHIEFEVKRKFLSYKVKELKRKNENSEERNMYNISSANDQFNFVNRHPFGSIPPAERDSSSADIAANAAVPADAGAQTATTNATNIASSGSNKGVFDDSDDWEQPSSSWVIGEGRRRTDNQVGNYIPRGNPFLMDDDDDDDEDDEHDEEDGEDHDEDNDEDDDEDPTIYLEINRENIMTDTFFQLRKVSPKKLLVGIFEVHFNDEEGIDAGGLTREWLMLVMREFFKPSVALFTPAHDGVTFQPNPNSWANPEHLEYMKLIGRLVGKAIAEGYLLDVHFTGSFYKHILGIPVNYHDLESIEPDYFKSLTMILNTPLEDLGMLGTLTFSSEDHHFGALEVTDLIPNGRNIYVTDENKMEYVQYIAHHRMTSSSRKQIDAFLEGFHQCIPSDAISIFDPTELELVICGCPEIDIDDLRRHTTYTGYHANDPIIVSFWKILQSFSKEEKALFIQFVTGSSKVPLEGFRALQGQSGPQQFSIQKTYGSLDRLPTAHTCFNQLDLPNYEDEVVLAEKLSVAIKEGTEGFGFS